MTNGNITEFTSKNPEVNRLRLVCPTTPPFPQSSDPEAFMKLAEAASGLQYLHSMGIIHGDLNPVRTTQNFLVSH